MKWGRHPFDSDVDPEWDTTIVVLKLCAVVNAGILASLVVIALDAWLVRLVLRVILPG